MSVASASSETLIPCAGGVPQVDILTYNVLIIKYYMRLIHVWTTTALMIDYR